ncbi:MAG: LysR family transcriptional regulator [Paracoccaceae bacterium]
MISSADLKLVDAIAKGGSLRMAARELGVTSSAISQKLAKLEERLKIQLAQRSGRAGLVLTAEGGWLAEQAGDILNRLKGLEADLSDRKGVVAGVLSVVAPLGLGVQILRHWSLSFVRSTRNSMFIWNLWIMWQLTKD